MVVTTFIVYHQSGTLAPNRYYKGNNEYEIQWRTKVDRRLSSKGATNNIVTFNCHHNERHLGRRGQHTPFDYGIW